MVRVVARPTGCVVDREAGRRADCGPVYVEQVAQGREDYYAGEGEAPGRWVGAGVGEATALRWRDVDLARGKIVVGRSKTDAGIRVVDVLPVLQDELTAHRANVQQAGPDDLVFPTAAGSRRDKDNARERVVRPSSAPTSCLPSAARSRCQPA